jgi:hypothetical protein
LAPVLSKTTSPEEASCNEPVVLRTGTLGGVPPLLGRPICSLTSAAGVRAAGPLALSGPVLRTLRVAITSAELRSAPATTRRSPAMPLRASHWSSGVLAWLLGDWKPALKPRSRNRLPAARKVIEVSAACGMAARSAATSRGRFQSTVRRISPADCSSAPARTRKRCCSSGCWALRRSDTASALAAR